MADVKEFNINGTVYDIKDATARSGLSGKADTGLTNINNSGTSKGAGWAMPSSTYEDLTVGADGTSYTAPANGWYSAWGTSNSTGNNYIILSCFSGGLQQQRQLVGYTGNVLYTSLPAQKGTSVTLNYGNMTSLGLRFYYAEGSKSEYTPPA